VQASIPGVSPPESARALLKNAIQAVQEARTERQSARIWADEVKDEVIRWVSEQRELIRSESLANNSPTSAATTVSCLMQLEKTIQNLHHDLARSSSSREDSDRKLEQLLLDQAEQIRSMSSQLDILKEKLNTVAGARSDSTINANAAKNLDAVDGTTTPVFYSSSTGDVPRFIERPGKGNTVSRSILSATTYSSSNSQRNRRKTHNGGYITEYSNGSVKEVHPDGTTVTRFPNGDVETKFRCLSPARKASTPSSISAQASPPGIVAYFHSKDSILQISQRDGSKLFEYPNGQVEKHYPDGFKMILFSDGTKQGVTKDGRVIEYSK
jgi:centromere protein J